MARHWSRFVPCVSERQAMALDAMAEAHGMGDGMGLLEHLTGCSRSKVGRMDRLNLKRVIDRAFREYGRKAV